MLVSTPKESASQDTSQDDLSASGSCRRKLEYSHIWNQIDLLCSSSANINNSFQSVFGEETLETFGNVVCGHLDSNMNIDASCIYA